MRGALDCTEDICNHGVWARGPRPPQPALPSLPRRRLKASIHSTGRSVCACQPATGRQVCGRSPAGGGSPLVEHTRAFFMAMFCNRGTGGVGAAQAQKPHTGQRRHAVAAAPSVRCLQVHTARVPQQQYSSTGGSSSNVDDLTSCCGGQQTAWPTPRQAPAPGQLRSYYCSPGPPAAAEISAALLDHQCQLSAAHARTLAWLNMARWRWWMDVCGTGERGCSVSAVNTLLRTHSAAQHGSDAMRPSLIAMRSSFINREEAGMLSQHSQSATAAVGHQPVLLPETGRL